MPARRNAPIAPSDADAGERLIAYLKRKRRRASFLDILGVFGAQSCPEMERAVDGLLMDLMIKGALVEPVPRLYCLPECERPLPVARREHAPGTEPSRDVAHSGADPGSAVERWMLRRIRSRGLAVDLVELGALAERAGVADEEETLGAIASLERRRWIERLGGRIALLTGEGIAAADDAGAFARRCGEPPMPISEECLPSILWIDDD